MQAIDYELDFPLKPPNSVLIPACLLRPYKSTRFKFYFQLSLNLFTLLLGELICGKSVIASRGLLLMSYPAN